MGVLLIDQKTLAVLILFLVVFCVVLLVGKLLRFIGWVLRSVWYLLTGRRVGSGNPLKSSDWLTRAQARQEIRFKNSLPQVLASEMESEGKRKKKKRWGRKESGVRWNWDPEKNIWIAT